MSFKKFKRLKEDSHKKYETHIGIASSFNLLLKNIEEHSFGLKKHKDNMEDKLWTMY